MGLVLKLYTRFDPTEFALRFANGTSVNAYDIINLEPLSPSPIYGENIEGANRYKSLIIMYQQDVEPLAQKLAEDMKNGLQENRKIFPGFNQVLKTDIEIDMVSFNRYKAEDIYDVYTHHGSPEKVFPLIILPKVNRSIYDSIYYKAKAIFLANDIPSQVITEDLIRDSNRYRWSLLSISIQIFAKMGGVPYALDRSMIRVGDPSDTSIAIMGLGISIHPIHKKRGVGFVTVFDHNGVWNFMDANVMSMNRQEDMSEKIASLLERSINKILSKSSKRNNILVIHYSGKEVGRREEEAIKNAMESADSINKFASIYVLKIRDSDIVIGYQDGPHKTKNGTFTWYPPIGTVFQLKPDVYAMITTGYFDLGLNKVKANIHRGLPTVKIIARHREIEPLNDDLSVSNIDLLATVFGMSRLNYVAISNPVSKEPVTIRYSKEIAWITLRLSENGIDLNRLSRIRYVMWFL